MGLGTGLNACLSLQYILDKKMELYYHACEAFPVEIQQMNHLRDVSFLNDLMNAPWNIDVNNHPQLTLHKSLLTFEKLLLKNNFYHLVYWDAFSPEKQPELWSEETFQKIFLAMKADAILCTYCAKGAVKRTLKAVGFCVETLQGPPGKREMIRARKR